MSDLLNCLLPFSQVMVLSKFLNKVNKVLWPWLCRIVRKPPLRNAGTEQQLCLHWNGDFHTKGESSNMSCLAGRAPQVPCRLRLKIKVEDSQGP